MKALPQAFKDNILSLFPEEAGYFFDALSSPVVSSVRLNLQKESGVFQNLESVPGCAHGRFLAQRPVFTEDPLFHAGAYYVQESSSMFLHDIIRYITQNEKPLLALDLCAAPGGKSTLLLDALPKGSLLVSNEIIKSRVTVLQENLIRWGNPGVVVSNNDPKHFQKTAQLFDLILVDAPCSGEGLWRRDPKAMDEWSEEAVNLCAARQERIIHDILPALKPGGILVYATCTFNARENEMQVQNMIRQMDLEPFLLNLSIPDSVKCTDQFQFRFLPHLVRGEGLFMAVLRKKGEEIIGSNRNPKRSQLNFISKKALPELHRFLKHPEAFDFFEENEYTYAFPLNWIKEYEILRASLYIKYAGICMGKTDKGGRLIPEHALAQSIEISEKIPRVELSKDDALIYLRKGNLQLTLPEVNGWCLAVYEGLPLGWMKVLPNRINNYFPAEYRILKELSEF